ncbi:MAG: hypothetical protein ACK5G7_00740 [Erysipelotrichaceae bacterium]
MIKEITNSNNIPGIKNNNVIDAFENGVIFETDKAIIIIEFNDNNCIYSFVS